MFTTYDDEGFIQLIEGISIKTLVWGEKTLTAKFSLKKGSILPLHRHPHEQTGYMISGRMRFEVDGKIHEAGPGDSWCIEGDVRHGAEVLADSQVLEVFSPMRQDYLPQNLRRR